MRSAGSGFGAFTTGDMAALACIIEAGVPKPGNVHPGSGFQSATRNRQPEIQNPKSKIQNRRPHFLHFAASAVAMGRLLGRGRMAVGASILECVRASLAVQAGGNTHFGTAVLFAPLAKAGRAASPEALRSRLGRVLRATTVDDAVCLWRACRLARPGGVPRLRPYSILDPGTPRALRRDGITLRRWMEMGAPANSIAAEYATAYRLTFEVGLPALLAAMTLRAGVIAAFLNLLAAVPDTHIAARHGAEAARLVQRRARRILHAGISAARVRSLDRFLRRRGWNPGTTADLTAAAIYAGLLGGAIEKVE